jgi:Na+-transporting methylmalonyl-CoA/oxaloacetate decarboxylase gamma subunit
MKLDWQNVVAHDGWGLTVAGMGIVFTALVLVSLYIAVLPKILLWVNRWLPEADAAGHVEAPKTKPAVADKAPAVAIKSPLAAESSPPRAPESSPPVADDLPLAVAAAAALHAHANGIRRPA